MVVCALYSCQQYYRMQMGNKETCQAHTSSSNAGYDRLKSSPSTEIEPNVTNSKKSTEHNKQSKYLIPDAYVILIPNYGSNASTTDKVKKELENTFRKDVMVLQIKSLEEVKETDPIGEWQIEKIYEEILCTLIDRYTSKQVKEDNIKVLLKEIPMHILGPHRLVAYFAESKINFPSVTFNNTFNVKTLSFIDKVDKKNPAQGNHIKHLNGFEDNEAYIDCLKEQQKQNKRRGPILTHPMLEKRPQRSL